MADELGNREKHGYHMFTSPVVSANFAKLVRRKAEWIIHMKKIRTIICVKNVPGSCYYEYYLFIYENCRYIFKINLLHSKKIWTSRNAMIISGLFRSIFCVKFSPPTLT